jgi:hypothetical protein
MRLSPPAGTVVPSLSPPIPDIEMPDTQQEPHQSIEDVSDKGAEEEEEELDYEVEWKVLLRKEHIISDIISRSEFRFATLCWKAKEKAQILTSKKKDDDVLSYKAQMGWKRERAFEFTIDRSSVLNCR